LEVNFEELYENHIKALNSLPMERDDVIKMDVARSFTNHKNFEPEVNILPKIDDKGYVDFRRIVKRICPFI